MHDKPDPALITKRLEELKAWCDSAMALPEGILILGAAGEKVNRLPNGTVLRLWRQALEIRKCLDWRCPPPPERPTRPEEFGHAVMALQCWALQLREDFGKGKVKAQETRPKRRRRMSVAEANEKGMALARLGKKKFLQLPIREQARRIGCHWRTWTKTDFYNEKVKRSGRPKANAPGTTRSPESYNTSALEEAVVGDEGREEALNKLIADQAADFEPSPLAHEPKRVHVRKRV